MLFHAVSLLSGTEKVCCVWNVDCSRLFDEDEELSEVTDSDVVPEQVKDWLTSTFMRSSTKVSEQVKDWLTSTFTRSLTNVRRRGDERLKFRSVANAIRAGIVVDRCSKQSSVVHLLLSLA